jgi:hypothetical protein
MAYMAKQHDELTQGRRLHSELSMLRDRAHHLDVLRLQESASRQHLEQMLTVKLALRAKGYLDRAPRLKNLLRNVLRSVS